MAEESNEPNGAAQAAQPQVRMQVLAQFVRDMSFENMVAKKGISGADVQPDIQVAVSLDARKRPADNQYDVISKYRCSSQSEICLRNSRSSHSRVAAKCSTNASLNQSRAIFEPLSRCAESQSVRGSARRAGYFRS